MTPAERRALQADFAWADLLLAIVDRRHNRRAAQFRIIGSRGDSSRDSRYNWAKGNGRN